jgi:hypothetical protein
MICVQNQPAMMNWVQPRSALLMMTRARPRRSTVASLDEHVQVPKYWTLAATLDSESVSLGETF